MIRKLIRIVAGSQSRRQGPGRPSATLKLRPRMMELEGRALLSTFTGNDAVHHGDLETLRPAAGTPALNHVVLRGNSARVDGGLPNDGLTNHRDVAIRNNTGHLGSGLSGARDVTNARRVHPRRGATGLILSDNFNGTGGVPKNWTLFGSGVVKETAGNVTLTDSSGQSVGILSSVVFSPQGVNTTIQAQIKSVSKNPVGNAVVGILGAPNSNGPTGELAAGIDANGDVFVVVQQQTPAVSSVDHADWHMVKGYNGGPISLTLTIKSAGVTVSAGSFNSPLISFSNWKNFSLIDAFGNDAIPALVGASQQNQKGGSASFSSIKVSTAAPKRR